MIDIDYFNTPERVFVSRNSLDIMKRVYHIDEKSKYYVNLDLNILFVGSIEYKRKYNND